MTYYVGVTVRVGFRVFGQVGVQVTVTVGVSFRVTVRVRVSITLTKTVKLSSKHNHNLLSYWVRLILLFVRGLCNGTNPKSDKTVEVGG